MTELIPAIIPLEKGLSLQVPKLIAEPGSLIDCENYEQVDFVGQKRIDGYHGYNGSTSNNLRKLTLVTLSSGLPNDFYINVDGKLVAQAFVFLYAGIPANTYVWIPLDDTVLPVEDLEFTIQNSDDEGSVVAVLDPEELLDPNEYWPFLEVYNRVRTLNDVLPNRTIGLHWFRDRLYAIADLVVVSVEGDIDIRINDYVEVGANEFITPVLDTFVFNDRRILVFSYPFSSDLIDEAGTITHNNVPITVGSAAVPLEYFVPASIFYAVDEFQSLEEDGEVSPGWRQALLGWKVNFTDGDTLYGSLPALNQNISGLGVQGPTTTSGNNGRPLVLTQKVSITNKPVQVNGWKSNATPNSYAIDASLVRDIDTSYVYGDAFVSWGADTDPQLGPIVEYPADNKIKVTGV